MSFSTEIKQRLRVQILVIITSVMIVLWFDQQGWFSRIENAVFDDRMTSIRASVPLPSNVKIILIDESSLSFMAPSVGQFPWPRTVYAELLEFLEMGGAKTVLFDFLFTEPVKSQIGNVTEISPHDIRLAEATRVFPNTVHAVLFDQDLADGGTTIKTKEAPQNLAKRFGLVNIEGDVANSGLNNSYTLPIPLLLEATENIGVVSIDADDDGIYRRLSPLWEYQNAVYPAFSLSSLFVDNQHPVISVDDREIHIGQKTIPIDNNGKLLINFYGDYNAYSIGRVFQTYNQIRNGGDFDEFAIDPFEFEDAVVFVGSSAVGLADVKAVTNNAKVPGVYTHASAYANIITNDLLVPAQFGKTFFWVGVFSVLSVLFSFNIPNFSLKLLGLIGLPVIWWWWTGYQLQNNVVVNFTLPILSLALGWSWSFTYISFTEGATKKQVKKMLSQYVSEEMLNEVLKNPNAVLHAGGGHHETLSILFSDVRGFTKLSEALPADKVVNLLNCHFSEMSESIFEHRGTLDKFIGDAIMAFWGAPIKVLDHADLSVKAALDMIKAMDRVNQKLTEMELPSIAIGIGVNTGDVVLGNIGSDRKLDYTVIGDAVNVASRLEGITKVYGVPIVISETTRMSMQSARPCILLDHVRVKGKTEPSAIYSPLQEESEDAEHFEANWETAELCQRAFTYYQTQQWDKAEELYKQLKLDFLRETYLARINEFRQNPPPQDWDGVYTLTTK